MSEEIQVYQAGFIAPVVSVQNALIAYQAKKDLIEQIFHENVDYGKIPGTSKDTLLKAGAEKATSFFGLTPKFTDAEVVNDWTGENHGGEPFFFYRRTCSLYKGEHLIVSVDGSCNSWEKKYRYRWVDESQVPATVDKSKLKTHGGRVSEFAFAIEKAETTGKYGKPAEYWKRFTDAINNGTATPIKRKTAKGESPAWEIDGTMYCLPNEDSADIVNTVLKMADKRALVAATLIATGLSEYFTQDLEDFIKPGDYIEGHATDFITQDTPAQSLQGVNVKPQSKTQPLPAQNPMTLEEARARILPSGNTYDNLTVEQLTTIMLTAKNEESRHAAKLVLDWRNSMPVEPEFEDNNFGINGMADPRTGDGENN